MWSASGFELVVVLLLATLPLLPPLLQPQPLPPLPLLLTAATASAVAFGMDRCIVAAARRHVWQQRCLRKVKPSSMDIRGSK